MLAPATTFSMPSSFAYMDEVELSLTSVTMTRPAVAPSKKWSLCSEVQQRPSMLSRFARRLFLTLEEPKSTLNMLNVPSRAEGGANSRYTHDSSTVAAYETLMESMVMKT